MLSAHRTGAARTSLVVLSFLVLAVHSFIPAQPSNSTDVTASLLKATLNVFWFGQGQLTVEFARAVATSDTGNVATGALVHYSDDAPSGTSEVLRIATVELTANNDRLVVLGCVAKTPWVALVACDSNATDATQDDIFAHAKSSGAQAAVLYSLFSQTCVVTPSYNNSPLDVYVSTSLSSSRLVESTFRNIDTTKFSTFDPATLDSESANVTLAPSDGFIVDSGYLVAVIAVNVPIFSSAYTALPTSTGSNSHGSDAATTVTSPAPTSTSMSSSGSVNENAAVTNGLHILTLAGGVAVTLSLRSLA